MNTTTTVVLYIDNQLDPVIVIYPLVVPNTDKRKNWLPRVFLPGINVYIRFFFFCSTHANSLALSAVCSSVPFRSVYFCCCCCVSCWKHWDKDVCLNFAERCLSFLKDNVDEGPRYSFKYLEPFDHVTLEQIEPSSATTAAGPGAGDYFERESWGVL